MKFIHFEIPKDSEGVINISVKDISDLLTIVSKLLPNDVKCIATPFKITWNNEIAEISDVNNLNMTNENRAKFLEMTKQMLEDFNIKYTILNL